MKKKIKQFWGYEEDHKKMKVQAAREGLTNMDYLSKLINKELKNDFDITIKTKKNKKGQNEFRVFG
jgi:hypothetical protein